MTPTLRPGPTPNHPPTELCHSCGMYWVVEGRVPEHRRDLFLHWTGPKGLAGAPVGISGGGGK